MKSKMSIVEGINQVKTLQGSCKICLKRLKKGIPKVNCMLFLNHLDYMHGLVSFER